MPDAAPFKAPFRATLDATLEGLRGLLETLNEEQQALCGDNPDQLEQCVQRKTEQLQQLQHSVQAREQILSQLKLPAGIPGAEQFIRSQFTPTEILKDWQALKRLAIKVEAINTHNGKLAFAGERSTRQALGILTGRPAGDDITYGRRRRQARVGSVSLGKC